MVKQSNRAPYSPQKSKIFLPVIVRFEGPMPADRVAPKVPSIYIEVLKKIVGRLKGEGITWALTGSLSFALQGVPVDPHDIDIQTDKEGAYRIAELFSEHITRKVRFSTSERIRSHFAVMMIDGVRIEIMGDIQKRVGNEWEPAPDLNRYIHHIRIYGMEIPVLDLNYEYVAYLKLGRYERAMILKSFKDKAACNRQALKDDIEY